MNEEHTDLTNGCTKVRTGTQNEAALLALMEKTGYNMVQENGQRKFGGPPPGKKVDNYLFVLRMLSLLLAMKVASETLCNICWS